MVLSSALDAFVPVKTRGAVSKRDRLIFVLAARHVGARRVDFGEALRALADATAELIPAGRIFLLGEAENGPVVGSLVSGVGLAERAGSVVIVRSGADGRWKTLGTLTP